LKRLQPLPTLAWRNNMALAKLQVVALHLLVEEVPLPLLPIARRPTQQPFAKIS
jgi:hypothetical protein